MAAMHLNTLIGCFVDCLRSMSSILSFHYFPLVVQTFLFSTHLAKLAKFVQEEQMYVTCVGHDKPVLIIIFI